MQSVGVAETNKILSFNISPDLLNTFFVLDLGDSEVKLESVFSESSWSRRTTGQIRALCADGGMPKKHGIQ